MMDVRLIPVIEIYNWHDTTPLPGKGPFWEYPDDWAQYYRKATAKAGFSDKLKPYLKGSCLYKIDEITDEDLLVAIQSEIENQKSDKTDEPPLVSAFNGGYILQVNGDDMYFPQCCGDLADIELWLAIVNGAPGCFWAGHPTPKVSVTGAIVRFDFTDTETGENFTPPVLYNIIELDLTDLKNALIAVVEDLKIFGLKLQQINERHQLGLPDIDKTLIFRNS